jgi:hypothetical protein
MVAELFVEMNFFLGLEGKEVMMTSHHGSFVGILVLNKPSLTHDKCSPTYLCWLRN